MSAPLSSGKQVKPKKLSNAFSTGSGGALFEAHVQAAFVTLMITGGHSPCFPSKPIVEIKLQGKIDGYATDDLIVTTGDYFSSAKRKILGQVKHVIAFTKGEKLLGEVLHAAWDDFNNASVFSKGKDVIALITGPLSGVDQANVPWLLERARATANSEEFFRHVKQANFSPPKSEEKLDALRFHLDAANGHKPISDEDVFQFLRHFHLLGYDLDIEYSVTRSLLHSHISQFQRDLPAEAWLRVVALVQQMNKHAGSITKESIPEEILELFKERAAIEIPKGLGARVRPAVTDWVGHPDASLIALALLIGAWNEK